MNYYIEVPLLVILLIMGLFLSLVLKFYPQRKIKRSIRMLFNKRKGKQGNSPYAALCTLLAATIGTGNIVGVATAIMLGGAGVLGWMWIAAFLGMSTQFAECELGARYREKGSGGAMYTMKNGIGGKQGLLLGSIFALTAVISSFGIGNLVQTNTIAITAENSFGIAKTYTGILVGILVLGILLGGMKRIINITSLLVPVMSGVYVLCGILVIINNHEKIIPVFISIIKGMYAPKAVFGGGVAGIFQVMYQGLSKGVFSNEAGLGSSSIAAAATDKNPVENGYIGSLGAFFDTLIVCSVTGLALLTSGVNLNGENGICIINSAFESVLGNFGGFIISMGIILFAFTSVLGWEYIGEASLMFLAKNSVYCYIYRSGFALVALIGAVLKTAFVWNTSAIINAFMMFPNLASILLLWKPLKQDLLKYEREQL